MKNTNLQNNNNVISDIKPNNLKINKIALVGRNYNVNNDFMIDLKKILLFADNKKCDTLFFSLFTILNNNVNKITKALKTLKNIKTVLIEQFDIRNGVWLSDKYVIFYNEKNQWKRYSFKQKFANLTYTKQFEKNTIYPFIKTFTKDKVLGNFSILLCGETNIVKYSKSDKKIIDKFDFLTQIPNNANIILNPIHDRMTRFEMKLKRIFLSRNNKTVISVWNKGKQDKNGNTRDGKSPPWSIFENGKEVIVNRENIDSMKFNDKSIEIGFISILS